MQNLKMKGKFDSAIKNVKFDVSWNQSFIYVRVRSRGKEMLVFWKILRTY